MMSLPTLVSPVLAAVLLLGGFASVPDDCAAVGRAAISPILPLDHHNPWDLVNGQGTKIAEFSTTPSGFLQFDWVVKVGDKVVASGTANEVTAGVYSYEGSDGTGTMVWNGSGYTINNASNTPRALSPPK